MVHSRRIAFGLLLVWLPVTVMVRGQDIRIQPYAQFQMDAKKGITALVVADGQNRLLAGDDKGNMQLWDLESKRSAWTGKLKKKVVKLGFLSHITVFGADGSGNILRFDTLTGNRIDAFKTRVKPRVMALDAGKRFLAVAGEDRIEIFDLDAGMPAGMIDARGKLNHLLFLGFNRLGEQLIAITERAKVASWNPATQRLLREFELTSDELHGSKSVIQSAATNRASNVFVVGLQEVAMPKGGLRGRARPTDLVRQNMILAYDWDGGFEIKRVKFPFGTVKQIALGPGNDHVAVSNNKNRDITLVDLRKGELGGSVTMPVEPLIVMVSENDRWLVAGGKNGKITVWSLDYREKPTAETLASSLPTLSGRIRADSNKEPALPRDIPATFAILNFEAKGLPKNIGDAARDMLTTYLANFDHISLVERQKILAIIEELKLQASDMTEEDGAKVGRLLNADRVLLGSVGAIGSNYIFNVRIVDVETARVVSGRQVMCEECRDRDLFDAINLLGTTIAR